MSERQAENWRMGPEKADEASAHPESQVIPGGRVWVIPVPTSRGRDQKFKKMDDSKMDVIVIRFDLIRCFSCCCIK